MANLFLALAIIAVLWGTISALKIVIYLSNRGVRINYLFLRVLIIKYVHNYHDMTAKEKGRPGPWYYSYVTSMLLALLFGIVGLSLK